jgi:hypothetical protein
MKEDDGKHDLLGRTSTQQNVQKKNTKEEKLNACVA